MDDGCSVSFGCANLPSLRVRNERVCVECFRRAEAIDPQSLPISLIRPMQDRCVVLRDVEKQEGLLIIPQIARDKHGRPKGMFKWATGRVLAVGPGYWQHKSGNALTIERVYNGLRDPVYARVGDHVLFKNKFDEAVHEWRGLTIVHDFDVLGVVADDADATLETCNVAKILPEVSNG